ncbi:Plasmid encoded RepA protein [Bifidobacterium aquikefiri]|uniref:Plasmid encoded RepA protein n=1 Tax=Bifidobacterium aquikefiri TaxID=1653207 RepID=A0A261G0T6_9BIFI|nr:replication protein RepA [Bifidobacterium aquikefiri]OZG64865.1 Plasmid encoded RepA protein [Bifidobacterium aquikefiri]
MDNDTTSSDVNGNNRDAVHEEHTGQEWQQLNSQQRLYLLTDFCKFSLPYTDPGNIESWKRVNGTQLYTVHPTDYVDANGTLRTNWLYGKIGRLLLIWISTQVMLRKADDTLTLVLPRSLNQLMKEIGIERNGGKPTGKDYARFRQSIQAVSGLHTIVTNFAGNNTAGSLKSKNFIIADTVEIYWSAQTVSNNSTIKLSKDTFDLIKEHSTPLDAAAVMLLTSTNPITKGRSRGQDLDLYCWLSARNYSLIHSGAWQTAPITWQQLANQFGNTYNDLHDFVRRFKNSLNNVRTVWPDLNVEIIDGQGIILHRSKRSVTAKRKPTGN